MDNTLPPLKRIAAIHDLSGLGKCSLTVALPVISATGVECACIPTAVLSTHTGLLRRSRRSCSRRRLTASPRRIPSS